MREAPGARTDAGFVSAAHGRIPCTSAAFAELSAEILRAGHALRFRARGGSMSPLLRDGDVVLVRPVEPRAVRVGDVVLCSSEPGRVVAHRVVRRLLPGRDGPRFTVQGDQVARADGVISSAEVYGRVVAIERVGAEIDMNRPMMKFLGRLAALRARWDLGRGQRSLRARRLIKRLPGLSRYLAQEG